MVWFLGVVIILMVGKGGGKHKSGGVPIYRGKKLVGHRVG